MASDRDYLLSLQAVREQSKKVLAIAQRNGLNHFEFDASRMDAVADYVIGVIDASILPAAASAVLVPPSNETSYSETLDQTSTIPYRLMGDGSTLTWVVPVV
jgi:hypothetical protein